MPPRSAEFLDDPERMPPEPSSPGPRRRWPVPLVLGFCGFLAFVLWAAVRHTEVPQRSSAAAAAAHAARSAPDAVPPPRHQPAGCPRFAYCDVSRDVPPTLVSAVRRHFATARPLDSYSLYRSDPRGPGGGLQYRQVAFTVPNALLAITVRPGHRVAARLHRVVRRGRSAAVHVRTRCFDIQLWYAAVAGRGAPTRRLLAVAREPALTALG